MSSLVGNYEHVRDENTDEYFKCVGVPYVIRKMMLMTSPKLMIQHDVDDKWIIQITTLMRTSGMAFRIGEEFQEFMPNGVTLTNMAFLEEDGSIIINSTSGDVKATRKYELNGDEMILTMIHEKSGTVAKRFFRRTTYLL